MWGDDRLNFFPIPYPGEILYSILARYSIRSGNLKIVHNLEDLFGTRNAIAVMELPTKLDALISNMPVGAKYTSDDFIYNNTLFPYYAPFITKDRGEKIISAMKSGKGDIYIRSGIVTSKISLNKYYRFCPECAKEDMSLYGELYWHRLHQAVGVFVCPKHQIPIYNSTVLIRGHNRQKFEPALVESCKVENEVKYSNDIMEKLLCLAQDIEILLNNNFGFKSQMWFKNCYRTKLLEKGYAMLNNMIHQRKLAEDISEFYGEEFLKIIQCEIPIDSECKWLSDLVRDNERTSHTLRHLILARFLGISLYELLNESGDIYNINDNWKVDDDKTICCINNKEIYCDFWEARLKELIKEGLSLRQIAKQLHSTTKTVKKHIVSLGIEPFWEYNGGKRYGDKNYRDTQEFKNRQKESREKWIRLVQQHPDKSKNELKLIDVTLGSWLCKYDKEWMVENSPELKSNYKPVDWVKRDKELLPKVKKVVEEMKMGKPERICWTTIGSKLGISGWLSKKRDKLPSTKSYIDSLNESIQGFQIRKIKWAIKEMEDNGESITYWRLLEKAGVKQRYLHSILKEVKQILSENGYSEDLITKGK